MGGIGSFFAWTGIVLGLLLLGGVVAVATVYEDAKPILEREFPQPIYQRQDDCEVPCMTNMASDVFVVDTGMREVSFMLYAVLDAASGPAHVSVHDPSGDLRYERLFVPETSKLREATQDSALWPAEPGEWTLTRTYAGTLGHLEYEALGIGLPPGTLG